MSECTGNSYKVGPRLRELTSSSPAARGSQEAGFTQPRAHLLADPCTVHWLTFRSRYVYKDIEEIVRVHIGVGNRDAGLLLLLLLLLLILLTCDSALTANEPLRQHAGKKVLVREHLKLVGLRRRSYRFLRPSPGTMGFLCDYCGTSWGPIDHSRVRQLLRATAAAHDRRQTVSDLALVGTGRRPLQLVVRRGTDRRRRDRGRGLLVDRCHDRVHLGGEVGARGDRQVPG